VHAALMPGFDRELQETHGLPLLWYDVATVRRALELDSAGVVESWISQSRDPMPGE
jgi:hypothetical protein